MLTKLDLAIIALLSVAGTTAAVEANHRTQITAADAPAETIEAPMTVAALGGGCKSLALYERLVMAQAMAEGANGLVTSPPSRCSAD